MNHKSIHAAYAALIVLVATGAFVLAAGDGPAPRLLPYRGHLNLDGAPVTASLPITFELYDDDTAGSLLHTEPLSVDVVAGDFAVLLGQTVAIEDAAFTAAELFVAITVDGTPLAGRQRIGAAHRVMDHPGTFTVGTLSATAVSAGSVAASGSITGATMSASSIEATADVTTPGLVLTGSGTSNAIRNVQSGVIGTCNGTDHSSQAASVTFSPAFASAPVVMLTVGETDDAGCTSARIRGINNTSFAWRSYSGVNSQPCDCIHWIAIGQD